jgi:hypothetical protein
LRASSELLPIRVLIRSDRELNNPACGKTLSFLGNSTERTRCGSRRSKSIASDQPPPTDEMILQQPGAAGMLCWQQLPPKARPTILNQANDTIGLTPVPNLRTEIYD